MESIMVFEINGQLFGYNTKFIKESVTVDKIFAVPNSKKYIKGIFNLRNNPIPLIESGILLWEKPLNSDVVIVIEKNKKIAGILIDKLKGVIQVEKEKILDIQDFSNLNSVNQKFIEGYFEENNNIILMLNFDSLFEVTKSEINSKNIQAATKDSFHEKNTLKNIEKTRGYIIFQIKDEWFAVSVDMVQEILSFPENISPLPETHSWIKGLFILREQTVLLIDFPEFLGIDDNTDRERVILTKIDNKLVGIAVPYVKEIRWVEESKILPITNNFIKNNGIISLENGKRLVLILDILGLMEIDLSENVKMEDKLGENMNEKNLGKLSKFLHFKVGSINMAIDIKEIQEVVEYHTINELPKSPEHILGMMNLRNSVFTVISLEKKLNIEDSKVAVEDKRIIVLDGKPVSLLVDNLEGILSLSENDIFAPDDNLEIDEKYLKGITKGKNDDLIFLLKIEEII